MALKTESHVTFHSSDRGLEKGFERLKRQALHWVFEGYPVGDYYEAALPNRDAFCMRDASHQCTGGEVLGLSKHNKNMFLKFARSISDARDWCAHWEIDRFDRPCPVDHHSDQDFWYNLPGNFDMLDACLRMYLWTGDESYLTDKDLDYFYAQTMEAYINRWDSNGDGLPDRRAADSAGATLTRRGVPGYDESASIWNTLQTATDLVASMARAHISYAQICKLMKRTEQAAIYHNRGEELVRRLNQDFYTDKLGFAKGLDFDGKLLYTSDTYSCDSHMLYWDAVPDIDRCNKLVNAYASEIEKVQIESLSHFPEILWRYGRNDSAMQSLWKLMDENLSRKEYPEASFCAIGAFATGLMGISPNAASNTIRTISGLVDTDWAELAYIPVFGGEISVSHKACLVTQFSWDGPKPVIWQPAFHDDGKIMLNGAALKTNKAINPFSGRPYVYAKITVQPGETFEVKITN